MNLSNAIQGYLLFKAARASAETIKTDKVLFGQFLAWRGDCDVAQVSADDLRSYLDHQRGRGLKDVTLRRHHSVVSSLYRWLASPEVAIVSRAANPARGVPIPKEAKTKPKAISQPTINALLKSAETLTHKRRARAILLFLLDSGARASELCRVRLDDVDFHTGRVLVAGKGNKQRYVYLGQRALAAVWLYVQNERPTPAQVDVDRLFLTADGYPLDRFKLRRIVVRLAKRAAKIATPHAFRHSSAIGHLRNGMNLVILQHLLGHERIETTRRYLTALDDEDVERAAQRTSPVDNWRL
jgi:site-specific recombinase XerD